jgi:hypothetical protein
LASWNWGVINKEIGLWSLQLPTLNTNNHRIFSLGNETKHKGITKGNGGLAINACYGIDELKEGKI